MTETYVEDYAFGCLGDEEPLTWADWLVLALLLPGGWVFLWRR